MFVATRLDLDYRLARSHRVAPRYHPTLVHPRFHIPSSISRHICVGNTEYTAYFHRDHNSAIIDSQPRLHTETNTCKVESRQDRLTRFLRAISRPFRWCRARVRCLTARDISRISLCLSLFIYLSFHRPFIAIYG